MEAISKLVGEISESFEDIGLYMFHHGIATNDQDLVAPDGDTVEPGDFRDKLISGEANWIITGHFNIGEVAWRDRTLKPELFETEVALQEQMPTELDVYRKMMKEAEGDPFKFFEMMDGDDDEDGSGS